MFKGVVIKESLEDQSVLDGLRIVSTEVEPVTPGHKTPWVNQWTLHAIEIPEEEAARVAEELCGALDKAHNWYADFKNDTHHYIIFNDKVFYVDRSSKEQYDGATQYGILLGIPAYQVDFSPNIQKWER